MIFITLLLLVPTIALSAPTFSSTPLDEHTQKIEIAFDLKNNDCVYKDYLSFSTDHPNITLSDYSASHAPQERYDSNFKNSKVAYYEPVTFSMTAHADTLPVEDAHIHVGYYQKSENNVQHNSFPIGFHAPMSDTQQKSAASIMHNPAPTLNQDEPRAVSANSWSAYFSDILQNTDSSALRLLLALLLGLILSLTPCIYPMIPITIGILQAQGSRSVGRNFVLSFSYTLGIATTFALLGLLAAFTGQLFGSLLTKPGFVLTIVALLIYLAGSMMGLYEMYIPRFMHNAQAGKRDGSILSAFTFGAVSGTVASPCLSPGLLLLLTLVTTLGSKILGFLLLFSFGMGLGLPLLAIGTFSSSMSVLPQAGMWMVEIKKFFGWIMLGTCLYFLQNIVPAYIIMWIAAGLILSAGIFYLHDARKSTHGRTTKNALGMLLIIGSVLMSAHAFKTTYKVEKPSSYSNWLESYEDALERAKKENKLVFLDLSGSFCTICKEIDNTVFCCTDVQECLDNYIAVKIENPDSAFTQKFNVVGVPTFIIIDPHTQQEMCRWGADLYDADRCIFVQDLERYCNIDAHTQK